MTANTPGGGVDAGVAGRGGGVDKLPQMPRNHRNRCKGRTVIRWETDGTDDYGVEHRRGDPILDFDNARQYRPCQAWGAHGTEYCAVHGGSAPQTIAAAKRTLSLSAHDVATALINIANDTSVSPETRVKAQAQVLDRIGIRLGVDVNLEVPKWQQLIGKMFGKPEEGSSEADEPESVEPTEEAAAPAPRAGMPPETPRPKAKKAPRSKAPNRPGFQGW